MSLDTLLEAAHYLELRADSKPKTRDEPGRDFHRYAKSSPPGYNSDGSNDNSSFEKFYTDLKDNVEKRRAGGAGTREVHNKLEKNRRAHLKECFDTLKDQVPSIQDKKTSNLTILRGALRYIHALKRKEKDFEQEIQKWAYKKIAHQQKIQTLRCDLNKMNIEFDLDLWVSNQDQETASTSTASENGSLQLSDDEDAKKSVITPTEVKVEVPVSTPPVVTKVQTSANRPKLLNAAIMTPVVPPTYRTPVTQILHQTITQRAAMQQLQMLQRQQKETAEKVTTVQSSNIRPTAQLVSSMPPVRPQVTMTSGVTLQTNHAPYNAQLNAVSKLASAVAMPLSTTNAQRQNLMPIVSKTPTTVVTMVTGTTSPAVSQPVMKQTPIVGTMTMTPTVTTPAAQVGMMGNAALNQTLTASLMNHGLTNHNTITAVPTNIKQLLSAPGTHLVSAGTQLTAINPLRTSTLGQMLSTVTNVGGVNIAGANQMSTVHPVVSLAHITPGSTHIMSPVSMVSPNVHVSHLSQQQINNMIQQQPLLKSLNQIPLLQPQFLQTGQVVGQQMVKPVVLVPSGVTTSTGQPGQVTVSVTRSSS